MSSKKHIIYGPKIRFAYKARPFITLDAQVPIFITKKIDDAIKLIL